MIRTGIVSPFDLVDGFGDSVGLIGVVGHNVDLVGGFGHSVGLVGVFSRIVGLVGGFDHWS